MSPERSPQSSVRAYIHGHTHPGSVSFRQRSARTRDPRALAYRMKVSKVYNRDSHPNSDSFESPTQPCTPLRARLWLTLETPQLSVSRVSYAATFRVDRWSALQKALPLGVARGAHARVPGVQPRVQPAGGLQWPLSPLASP